MTTETTLLSLVPIGEENAVSARQIWEIERVWTPASIKMKLHQLTEEGLIERTVIAHGQNRKTLYFRKPAEPNHEAPE
jgi:hypothetical protein